MVVSIMELEHIFLVGIGGIVGLMWWSIKRFITTLNDVENRVIVLETVIELVGDIRSEISSIKSDVEVIKAKMEKS